MRATFIAIALASVASGCTPIAVQDDARPDGGAQGGDGPDGGAGGADEPGAARLALAFERDDERHDDVQRVEVEVVGAIVFTDHAPEAPQAGAPCDAQGGARTELPAHVELDLASPGRTPIGNVTLDARQTDGGVGEIRLLVRAIHVDARGKHRAGHGRLTCVDGRAELVVFRFETDAVVALQRGRAHDLLAHFHARGDVQEEQCDEHGGDRGDDDDGDDACHRDDGRTGRGSRFLLGQHYPLSSG